MIDIDVFRAALRRRGMHQFELANALGVTETLVSRLACGRVTPDDAMKKRIARELRVSVADLFREEG